VKFNLLDSAKINFFEYFKQTIIFWIQKHTNKIIMSKGQAQQQQSAFKQLFTEFFNQGGDFNRVSKDLKKPLKTYVKESYPHFLVTDGYFFVQPHFTKEAVAEFH